MDREIPASAVWNEQEWKIFLRRIDNGKVLPFLGAGASVESLPLAAPLSRALAYEYFYPDEDVENLSRVSFFVDVKTGDPFRVRGDIADRLRSEPQDHDPDAPHQGLVALNSSVYVTTNYDMLIEDALVAAGKSPRVAFCAWTQELARLQDDLGTWEPTGQEPLVFHLHGHLNALESMVVSEEDYIDHLRAMQQGMTQHDASIQNPIPWQVQRALADSLVLFVGYGLRDWNVRVLLDGVESLRKKRMLAVLGQAPDSEELRAWREAEMDLRGVDIYWDTAREFASELRRRTGEHEGD